MKINDILTERISDIVYHATSLHATASILKNKKINLTASSGTTSELKHMPEGKMYYMAVARGKTADYTLHNVSENGSAILVLNGQWFNNNLSGKAVDYWERYWLNMRKAGAKDRYSEMEDRIFSEKPSIDISKNPSNVIKEIHIIMNPERMDDRRAKFLLSILKDSKINNIPIYIYDNEKDGILQNKKNSKEISEYITKIKEIGINKEQPYQSMMPDYLKPYRELYYKNNRNDLSDKAKELFIDI